MILKIRILVSEYKIIPTGADFHVCSGFSNQLS